MRFLDLGTAFLRDVSQIRIAPGRVFVPAKHGVDRFLELSAAGLVDTASAYPKAQAITGSLFTAELNLSIPSLLSPSVIRDIFICDIFFVFSPSM
jgi:hypothetical protein